ncbi:MAG: hypothetical protein AAF677_06005 [Pseudomonadota bacterium]
MGPHPDFRDWEIPRRARLNGFLLTALGVDDLDEDYAAVVESTALIAGVMGDDWPQGLTRAQNLIDIAWHQKEFDKGRSFAWVIRDGGVGAAPAYWGCAYVSPTWERGQARTVFWFRTGHEARGQTFRTAWDAWLAGPVWPRLRYSVYSMPETVPGGASAAD